MASANHAQWGLRPLTKGVTEEQSWISGPSRCWCLLALGVLFAPQPFVQTGLCS